MSKLINLVVIAVAVLTLTANAQNSTTVNQLPNGTNNFQLEIIRFETNRELVGPVKTSFSGDRWTALLLAAAGETGFRLSGQRSGALAADRETKIELDAPRYAALDGGPTASPYPGAVLWLTTEIGDDQIIRGSVRFEQDSGVAEVQNADRDRSFWNAPLTARAGETVVFGRPTATGKYAYLAITFKTAEKSVR